MSIGGFVTIFVAFYNEKLLLLTVQVCNALTSVWLPHCL